MVKQLIITCSLISLGDISAAETMQTETPTIVAEILQQLEKGSLTQETNLFFDVALQTLSDKERAQLQASLTALLMKKSEAKYKATTWGNKLTSIACILSSTFTVLGIPTAISGIGLLYLEGEDMYLSRSQQSCMVLSLCSMAACILANALITPSVVAAAMYKNHKASKLRADKRIITALLARLQQPAQQA
jgi:hypothetical protein